MNKKQEQKMFSKVVCLLLSAIVILISYYLDGVPNSPLDQLIDTLFFFGFYWLSKDIFGEWFEEWF